MLHLRMDAPDFVEAPHLRSSILTQKLTLLRVSTAAHPAPRSMLLCAFFLGVLVCML